MYLVPARDYHYATTSEESLGLSLKDFPIFSHVRNALKGSAPHHKKKRSQGDLGKTTQDKEPSWRNCPMQAGHSPQGNGGASMLLPATPIRPCIIFARSHAPNGDSSLKLLEIPLACKSGSPWLILPLS